MIEQINNTTFEKILPCGEKVLIGNKLLPDFKPHLRMHRFRDENIYIDLSLSGVTEKTVPLIDGDKITWEGRDRHILMYPLAPDSQMELGGYEYEIILEKKPKTNQIIIDLQSQGLKFYYQPPLTQEEIEEGCIRPDNVVGGYAVYHATKGGMVTLQDAAKGITTGQGFFIYRPRIVDARGNWVWTQQFIDPILGKQIITIPQEFIDTATYPIRHIAGDTIGYTTIGGTSAVASANYVYGSGDAKTPSAGEGVSAHIYARTKNGGGNVQLALYDTSSPTEYLANSGSPSINVNDTARWWSENYSSPPTLAAVPYYVVFNRAIWQEPYFYYNDVGTNDRLWKAKAFGSWDATVVWSTSAQVREYSIYITYTPEGGGATIEGSASGSGIGLATSTGKLDVLASALGNGIGLAESSSYLEVLAQASGQGIGLATAQAILDVLAKADGSGIGLGTTEALIKVLAAAAASGEGLGAAEALLEVIAEAAGEGIGSGQGQSYIIVFGSGLGNGIGLGLATGYIPGVVVFGTASGSGVGIASTEALINVLASALGHGVGIASLEALSEVMAEAAGKGIGIALIDGQGWHSVTSEEYRRLIAPRFKV